MSSATLNAEDFVPVRSRISWGAILAGASVSIAVYFLLTLLGGAIGLSVGDRMTAEQLGTGAAIWAIASTVVALFTGGFVVSQISVGENKGEAAVYGVIMWSVVFAALIWLMASGVRAGFNAMVGMANVSSSVAGKMSSEDWEALALRAGVTQEQINKLRADAANAPATARQAATDPRNQEAAAAGASRAAWWAFFGTLLSMGAAVGGSVVGAGPTLRFMPVTRVRVSGQALSHS